ncbi:MAG TPA: STAS domain-containing protein [Atopobiaceae bacterium]|nr:STAS domain-containing protein [Atopobiaceae bacterium]
MTLELGTSEQTGISTVGVHGEVDVSCADELRTCISRVMEHEAKGICIDISDMSYIDSTGIGVLVGAAHAAAEQGISFEVVRPQRNVARVLELLGITGELGIVGR